MTDIFAPVFNSVIAGCSWTVMWLVALIPYVKASLITVVTSAHNLSSVGGVK